MLENCGVNVNDEGKIDDIDQELMEDTNVDEGKFWTIENKSKLREKLRKT